MLILSALTELVYLLVFIQTGGGGEHRGQLQLYLEYNVFNINVRGSSN